MTGKDETILVGDDRDDEAQLLNAASDLNNLLLGMRTGIRRIRAQFPDCDLSDLADRHVAPHEKGASYIKE